MKSLPILALATAVLLPLAACNTKPKADTATTDTTNETAVANAAPVEMPPAIKADKSFRCKDNSLAFVTFFEGDKQVVLKDKAEDTGTVLKAPNAGDPYVANGGYKLTGDDKAVTVTRPGKDAVSCHV